MFDIPQIGVMLRRINLKIEDDEDNESRVRAVECTFRIPILDFGLASQVRLPIVQHCFGRDHLPQWAVHDVHFAAPDDTYTASLHSAPDAPPTATLHLVRVIKVRVWRANEDRRDLSLEFVTKHELARGDLADLAGLLNAWEGGLTQLALETVQIPLPMADDDAQPQPPRPRSAPRRSAQVQ